MATPDPMGSKPSAASISATTIPIAGILTTIHGLAELPPQCESVAVLWLLHPRLGTKDRMTYIAHRCITDWNTHHSSEKRRGLIAVAFDQRNHGSRLAHQTANEDWRSGNPTHAQDMFGIYNGTVLDTSLLIDNLESYILLEKGAPRIDQHLTLGVSLGGHSAWQAVFTEPRITAAVVIIGCPDNMHMMTDRARLSKLETYTASSGADFLGSKDYPQALIKAAQKYDPKAILFDTKDVPTDTPSDEEKARLSQLIDSKVGGKKILVCSGAVDKLVPYRCSEPFLKFLKGAVGPEGWYKGAPVYVEDNVYDGAGHEFSKPMVEDSVRFISDVVGGVDYSKRLSKM